MLIHRWDEAVSEEQWRAFVHVQGFGHLVAAGKDRDYSVVVPTQFALTVGEGGEDVILMHLARPNPIWEALAENPHVVMSVAGDWAFIPASWKAIGEEDLLGGIPTTYYAAVQLLGTAEVTNEVEEKAVILRRQLGALPKDEGQSIASSTAPPWRPSVVFASPFTKSVPSSNTAATSTSSTAWRWKHACWPATAQETERPFVTCGSGSKPKRSEQGAGGDLSSRACPTSTPPSSRTAR